MRRALHILLSLVAIFPCVLQGQVTAHRCEASPYRQFDFWIGDWVVHNPQGGLEGNNRVTKENGGCVIVEHWSSPDQTGTSLSFYDFRTKHWYQQWVDSFGNTLLVSGGLVNGRMTLEGDRLTPEGTRVHERTTWYVQPDGHIRSLWDYSMDGGKSWIQRFDGIYGTRGQ